MYARSHYSRHLLSPSKYDTLNRYLLDFNKEVYRELCEKAISYYDMHATKEIKSFGN